MRKLLSLVALAAMPLVSAANETNLTGTVTTQLEVTPSFALWVVFVILFIAGLVCIKKLPIVSILFGMYGVIFGFIQILTVNTWFGLIILGVAAAIGGTAAFDALD